MEPDRTTDLAAMLIKVRQLLPEELERRGEAGRGFALRHLTREVNVARVVGILEKVAGEKGYSEVLDP